MGTVLTRKFHQLGEEAFLMCPTRLLANLALFSVGSMEMEKILKLGHFSVGKGVFTLGKWSTYANCIELASVEGPRWIEVWGLPLTEWSQPNFVEIGSRCGGMIEVDSHCVNREIISVVRMRVGASSFEGESLG